MQIFKDTGSSQLVIDKLLKQDNIKLKTENLNVIILNNFFDLILINNVDVKMISQIYMLSFLFKHICKTDQESKIQLNDHDNFQYNLLWKTDSVLKGYLNEFIRTAPWPEIDFKTYDYVICHPKDEEILIKHIAENYENEILAGENFPKFFALTDTAQSKITSAYIADIKILTNEIRKNFSTGQLQKITAFKETIAKDYIDYDTKRQEELFTGLLAKIQDNNQIKDYTNFSKILILEDLRRKFYIGDTYFWLKYLNINVRNIFPESTIRISCRDKTKANFFNKIFGPSLDDRLKIEYKLWDEIDFENYDLILYESDLTVRFLSYVEKHYSTKFKNASIFSYFAMNVAELENYSDWNYKNIYKKVSAPKNSINNVQDARVSREFELKIQEEERITARTWLEENGLKPGEKLVCLILNTSSPEKSLDSDSQLGLIKHMVADTNVKVLLFDEKGNGLKESLEKKLPKEITERIIIAKKTGIRLDMCLLSDHAILGIIGPCTGMMHLADGIYRYLKNNKIINKDQVPFMLVYVGNLAKFDMGYHPRHWWFNSLVKCAVFVKSNTGFELTKLYKLPNDIAGYNQKSHTLDKMSFPHLTKFIVNNYPEFSEQLFTQQFLRSSP